MLRIRMVSGVVRNVDGRDIPEGQGAISIGWSLCGQRCYDVAM